LANVYLKSADDQLFVLPPVIVSNQFSMNLIKAWC